MSDHEKQLLEMGIQAKKAFLMASKIASEKKDQALQRLAELLDQDKEEILRANEKDIASAKKSGLSEAMIDRLSLQGQTEKLGQSIVDVANMPDPIGEILETKTLPNGLILYKKQTPIGVIGIIYEARPNVTLDISAVIIKTGNAAILRGGSEALETNRVLVRLVQKAISDEGLPKDLIQFVDDPDRKHVNTLLKMSDYIDLVIPRGGAGLHQFCRENSTIPVITGGVGICHLFVDADADLKKALDVIDNAKTQRPTVCNALDTLLVHQKIAKKFLPLVIERLNAKKVSFCLDPEAMEIAQPLGLLQKGQVKCADLNDWDTEWLSLILGIKVVKDIDEAIEHIQEHSSGHSDGILTHQAANAERFIDEVDSAVVYVNASTRFTDAGEFGMGSEVIISTQKVHARGPMGLEGLTSYKWVVKGNYHIRQ